MALASTSQNILMIEVDAEGAIRFFPLPV